MCTRYLTSLAAYQTHLRICARSGNQKAATDPNYKLQLIERKYFYVVRHSFDTKDMLILTWTEVWVTGFSTCDYMLMSSRLFKYTMRNLTLKVGVVGNLAIITGLECRWDGCEYQSNSLHIVLQLEL